MEFDDIEHIIITGENTLCGFAIDVDATASLISEDDFQKYLKKINIIKQDKLEYNSNCKECISILRELRAIKM